MSDDVKKPGQPEEPQKSGKSDGLTRRDFIRLGGYTGAALSIPLALPIIENNRAKPLTRVSKSQYDTDVLILGSGFAGTFAALEARKNGQRVLVVDKGGIGWSGMSPWASDSRPFDESIYDRKEWHRNVATNTEHVNDRKWLDIFMDESLEIFWTLREMGAHDTKPFERGSRVFKGYMQEAGVEMLERVMMTSLFKDEQGRIAGGVGFTYDDSREESRAIVVTAKAVILCTGAGSYKSPGFPIWGQTFDGDAMAYRAGATVSGKEFNDTHTTFYHYPAAAYNGWEFAQSVTGAYIMAGPPHPIAGGLNLDGAINAYKGNLGRQVGGPPGGEPIPEGDPRDDPFVVRNRELYKGKGFLKTPDMTIEYGEPPSGGRTDMGHRVGGSTAGMGVHKGEGVVNSDYTCSADGVAGLWAAGDALASYLCGSSYPGRGFSSYGSAIQGRIAGRHAAAYASQTTSGRVSRDEVDSRIEDIWAPRRNLRGYSAEWAVEVLRTTMTPIHILYVKEPRRLEGALASLEFLRDRVVPHLISRDGHELRETHELKNMLLNAEMKLRAGLFREESRGTHYREDFPARNDKDWHCWVTIKEEDGKMVLGKKPIPEEWKPDSNLPYRERYPREFPGEDEFLANHPDWV